MQRKIERQDLGVHNRSDHATHGERRDQADHHERDNRMASDRPKTDVMTPHSARRALEPTVPPGGSGPVLHHVRNQMPIVTEPATVAGAAQTSPARTRFATTRILRRSCPDLAQFSVQRLRS